MRDRNLFEKYMFEADDDPPADLQPEAPSSSPPDSEPPDLGSSTPENQTGGAETPDEAPPDDLGGDEGFPPDQGEGGEEGKEEELGLDDKISAIMNNSLYQQCLSLLNEIGSQVSSIKNNSDIFQVLSSEVIEIITHLKKLDENIRIYLDRSFISENYSKNLLFYNKCLNLFKLLNDSFEKQVQKGIRKMGDTTN